MNKILIVDDQLYIRALISKELAKKDYQVIHLNCDEGIWESIRDYCPDLVLLGLHPKSFDCWKILQDAKQIVPDLPVLIYVIRSLEDMRDLKQAIMEVLGNKSVSSDNPLRSYPSF